MGARRHGQGGGHLPHLKILKSAFSAANIVSSLVRLDEVFMHYFEKVSSATGGIAPRPSPGLWPWTPLGDLRPSDPLIAHPWKKFCGRPFLKMIWQDYTTFSFSSGVFLFFLPCLCNSFTLLVGV